MNWKQLIENVTVETSIIQLETVSKTFVLDSLQFAFEFLIQIWIPS